MCAYKQCVFTDSLYAKSTHKLHNKGTPYIKNKYTQVNECAYRVLEV